MAISQKLKKKVKKIPLARWAWDRSPKFVRDWVGSKSPDLSTDNRPPRFRLRDNPVAQLKPDDGKDLSELLKYLSDTYIALHVSEGAETLQHQFDAWYSFCAYADQNLIVIVRRLDLFNEIARERPGVTALYVKNGLQAEWIFHNTKNLKAVLYVSNTAKNGQFVRLNDLTHIFLGHGDSEKSGSCGKHFRLYDEVWVAGQAHIDRFKNSGIDFSSIRFRIIGRPTCRSLCDLQNQQHRNNFLYLPTWEGYHEEHDYTSARDLESTIKKLSEITHLDCIAKFHPSTGKREKSLAKVDKIFFESGITIKSRTHSVIDLMKEAFFLISDISSVVSDFLVTGRPIFLYIPKNKNIKTTSSSVSFNDYCYIFSSPEELINLINQVIIQKNDSLRDKRLSARNYFVDIEATRNKLFEYELHKLMSGTSSPTDAIRLITHEIS